MFSRTLKSIPVTAKMGAALKFQKGAKYFQYARETIVKIFIDYTEPKNIRRDNSTYSSWFSDILVLKSELTSWPSGTKV